MSPAQDALSILVVDDDPAFCAIMRELLRRSGFEVRVAYDANAALAMMDCREPDLILTDIMMPEVDGIDLIRRVRSRPDGAEIPTIVISARVMTNDFAEARLAGANAVIPKPFSFRQLENTLSAYLPRPVCV
jgi:CheY-like chemotaxis protein